MVFGAIQNTSDVLEQLFVRMTQIQIQMRQEFQRLSAQIIQQRSPDIGDTKPAGGDPSGPLSPP